ncbi:MAG: hypothetical protein JO307_28580 [Bryobacterales bacterium]|nr:hypothetical protein [Bryobacterales bacterium]
MFALSAGILLHIRNASEDDWERRLIECTGSKAHLKKLAAVTGPLTSLQLTSPWPSEAAFYQKFGPDFIEPELREGLDEVDRAAAGNLPNLVSTQWPPYSEIGRGRYPRGWISGLSR